MQYSTRQQTPCSQTRQSTTRDRKRQKKQHSATPHLTARQPRGSTAQHSSTHKAKQPTQQTTAQHHQHHQHQEQQSGGVEQRTAPAYNATNIMQQGTAPHWTKRHTVAPQGKTTEKTARVPAKQSTTKTTNRPRHKPTSRRRRHHTKSSGRAGGGHQKQQRVQAAQRQHIP